MTDKQSTVVVSREALSVILRLLGIAEFEFDDEVAKARKQIDELRAILAATPEQAVDVGEPVGNEHTVYLIMFDDHDVKPEIVIGESIARRRYDQLSNSWNAHLFVKLDSNSSDDPHAKSNYRHARPPAKVDPDRLSNFIREIDGNHTLGAGRPAPEVRRDAGVR